MTDTDALSSLSVSERTEVPLLYNIRQP